MTPEIRELSFNELEAVSGGDSISSGLPLTSPQPIKTGPSNPPTTNPSPGGHGSAPFDPVTIRF
jgi:hypothetical protein